MMTYRKTGYGLRIKELRRDKCITQTELADKLGLVQADVSQLEAGKRALTLDTAVEISKALDVDLNDIVKG
ncbi:MAG: helix-turn-helix transcriptional regulator [Oscillospiraceae bacterium]|nr:helix-turn-helix transcriptional regulator [Oscillospiraceae bacterium]